MRSVGPLLGIQATVPDAMAAARRYVPELDSIRAGAVLAVMGTHSDLPLFDGGAVGVDVFFALSGFLITYLMLSEHARTGRISWRDFYIRRALRLLPAIALVSVFTIVLVLATARHLGPSAYSEIGQTMPTSGTVANTFGEVFTALFYVADFSYLFGVRDVFLGHTWSLSVEEQFYVLWPLAFVLIVSRLNPRVRCLAVGGTAALLAAMRIVGWSGPGGILQLRFDVLLAGVTLGLGLDHFRALRALGRAWLPALIAIVIVVITGPQDGASTSGRAVYSVVAFATLCVIVGCWDAHLGRFGPLFRVSAVVFIGRISYGLYLWHLPVFRRIAMENLHAPSVVVVALKFGMAFGLAIASFMLVERRALRLKRRFTPQRSAAKATASAVPER